MLTFLRLSRRQRLRGFEIIDQKVAKFSNKKVGLPGVLDKK
jgi:hypothetical protein